jgi:glycosyltransferase involved in cell wall biosynthesis
MDASLSNERDRTRALPRVALVLDGAGWAGTERHVAGLLGGLARGGWTVHLITSETGPLLDRATGLEQTHVIPRTGSVAYVRALSDLLRRLRPDVLHSHSGRLACLAARLAGVPAVIETRHGLPERLRPLYRRWPLVRRWEGQKCRLAHRTLTVCRADADWLEREAGLPPSRIRTVMNGLDLLEESGAVRAEQEARRRIRREWGLPGDARVLGLVGRLASQKAPGRALELLAGLRECGPSEPAAGPGPETWCVICGDGPLGPPMLESARKLGLVDRVRLLGPQPRAALLMPALDLVVIPSLWEGLPYVLLEAMAGGRPVLATPVGGVPELLTGPVLSQGCLPWDVREWSRAARVMLESFEAQAAWAAEARLRLHEFPESATVAGVEAVYRELLGPSGKREAEANSRADRDSGARPQQSDGAGA